MSQIEVVRFHGDELQVVREGAQPWVVMKRVCEALNLHDESQARKLKTKEWATTAVMAAVAEDGKTRELFCLHLDSLPMWLATIESNRVKPAAREKLIAYQKECARVLRDHFFGRPSSASQHLLDRVLEQHSQLMVQQGQVLAVVQTMVEQQNDLARRVLELERPSFNHGAISRGSYDQLRSLVRRIADTEAAVSKWKSPRAATADIHRELREATGWGGKAKPWHLLPAQLEQPAMAVLRRRLCDAERLVGSRQGQLMFGMGQRLS